MNASAAAAYAAEYNLSPIIRSKFDIIPQVAFISFAKPPLSSALSSHESIPSNDSLASCAEATLPWPVFVSIFDSGRYDEKSFVL
jgi:hypothetical protein